MLPCGCSIKNTLYHIVTQEVVSLISLVWKSSYKHTGSCFYKDRKMRKILQSNILLTVLTESFCDRGRWLKLSAYLLSKHHSLCSDNVNNAYMTERTWEAVYKVTEKSSKVKVFCVSVCVCVCFCALALGLEMWGVLGWSWSATRGGLSAAYRPSAFSCCTNRRRVSMYEDTL